jgi:amidase
VPARDVEKAREQHVVARDRVCSLTPAGTVLALPTAPCVAPPLDAPQDALESFRVRVMRLTCIAGLSGLPQVTLPVGSVGGCPVGLSFIGWAGSDETLLALCAALSRYCGRAE